MPTEETFGLIPTPRIGSHALTDAYLRGEADSTFSDRSADPLPSRYDSRDYGYVTSVKNQNPHGTCWAFATTAPIESYMIKHGIINPNTGAPASTSLDLSEYHLSWFSYTSAYDQAGMLAGDATSPIGTKTFLTSGGNGAIATYTLMNWVGPASEATSALAYSRVSTNGLPAMYAYNYDTVHVEDVLWIPGGNIDAIKRAILEYGACTINYYHNTDYMNPRTYAMCFKQTADPSSSNYIEPNHAVTVVGWDDNYSKSNFLSAHGPSNNGAWIIKNSWGSSVFDQGYFYLSYEDSSAVNDYCYFFKVADTGNYQHNYQYDGTSNFVSNLDAGNGTQIANVFTAQSSELLKAVAVSVWDEGVSYTLDIYKNPTDARNPSSGAKVSTQTGSFSFLGYFTVPLNTPVALNPGDRFAVVFTLNAPSASLSIPYDATETISWIKWIHANRGDTSFYRPAGGAWTDCPDNGDFRIKAYTDDYVNTVTYTVSAESNNAAYGTVSVSGNSIIASPAAGYVVSGCEVVSGTATYTINGNSILVSPESDCTIRVIFAEAPTYTVNLMVCGVKADSRNVLPNGTTVLPSTVSQSPEGWSFCGWASQPVAETSAKPSFYAPGASYTVTDNATLYALFTCTEGNSELGFQLLTAAPNTWEGNYVITYTANAGSMRVLKSAASTSVVGISSSTYAPTLASTGMTLNQNVLTNVSTAYQFTASAHGSYYWFQNVSTGSYLGGTTALYACTERYASFLDWSLSFQNGAPVLYNTYKSSCLNFNTGNGGYFCLTSGANTNIFLWKEMPIGTTYYSQTHTHELAYTAAVAPTCGEAGHSAYYFCEGCGKYFSDGNAQNEISLSSTVLPATGNHSFGGWISNHYGSHYRVCSVCGMKETVSCTYTDVVTPPTTTDQGYTTHTCTVCGYHYMDSFTPPIAEDYIVTFSVPSGVAPVASMTCAPNSSIILPTAGAPAGYTFLGWVHDLVFPTASAPGNIMKGAYEPNGNTTLYALYSYSSYAGVCYERVPYTLADWSGKYVITYGMDTSNPYVLKGLSGNTSYQNTSCGGTVRLANTGIQVVDGKLTGVNSSYVFTFAPTGGYYTILNNGTNTYLSNYSRSLYSRTSYSSLYCRWSISCSNGNALLKSTIYPLYPYLTFSSSNYFMTSSNTVSSINLWKETRISTTYYVTVID